MGVFAARNFKTGEVILKWNTSHELTKKQIDKLSEEEKSYVTYLNGNYISMQSPGRYVNHSCEANTHAEKFCDIANRNIKKCEEITTNYAEESVPELNMKCNCRNRNCKGIIKTDS